MATTTNPDAIRHIADSIVRELTMPIASTCLVCPRKKIGITWDSDLLHDELRINTRLDCKSADEFIGVSNPQCPDGANPRIPVAKDLGLSRKLSNTVMQIKKIVYSYEFEGPLMEAQASFNEAIADSFKSVFEDRIRDTTGWPDILNKLNPWEEKSPTLWVGSYLQDWQEAKKEYFEDHLIPSRKEHTVSGFEQTPYMKKHMGRVIDPTGIMPNPSFLDPLKPKGTILKFGMKKAVAEAKEVIKEPVYHNWGDYG